MKRTGPRQTELVSLIQELNKLSYETNKKIWKRVAKDLEKPTRSRRIVNLFEIDKNTSEGDKVIVPGKVLGTGELNHDLTIIAWSFSSSALEKIKNTKSKAIFLKDYLKKGAETNLKIIG